MMSTCKYIRENLNSNSDTNPVARTDNAGLITFSVSPSLVTPTDGSRPTGDHITFEAARCDEKQFITLLKTGKAISISTYAGNRRHKQNFRAMGLLVADYDNGTPLADILELPLVARYALAIRESKSHTPEHPRYHVFFALDTPITDATTAVKAAAAFNAYFENSDRATKDVARLFYGSYGQIVHYNPNARLPGAVLAGLVSDHNKATQQPAPGKRLPTSVAKTPGIGGPVDHAIDAIASAGVGSRNPTLFIKMRWLAELYAGGQLSHAWDDIERRAIQACDANGLNADDGLEPTKKTIQQAYEKGIKNPRYPQQPTAGKPDYGQESNISNAYDNPGLQTQKPTSWHGFPVAYINSRYFDRASLPDLPKVVLLIGNQGTGKTHFASQLIPRTAKLTNIGYRNILLREQAQKFSAIHHHDVTKGKEHLEQRICVTVDSFDKTLPASGQLPDNETIFIDETEQVIRHLATSETDIKNHRSDTYSHMLARSQNAKRIILADTDAGDCTRQFLADMGVSPADVLVVINEYTRQDLPTVEILPGKGQDEIDRRIFADIEAGKQIATVTDSINQAKDYESRTQARFDTTILTIHGDNTDSAYITDVMTDPNTAVNAHQVAIASPALQTGVDIQARRDVVYGVYGGGVITPTDVIQQIARFRQVASVVIKYPENPANPTRQESAKAIADYEMKANVTSYQINHWNSDGQPVLDEKQKRILRLASIARASENRQHNRAKSVLVARLKAIGYNVVVKTETIADETLQDDRQATKEARKEAHKQAVLSATPVDDWHYRQASDNSQMTDEILHGYQRWQIEQAYGRDITPDVYDHHATYGGLALARFDDLIADEMWLRNKELDETGKPLHDRQYRHLQRRLFLHLISRVFKFERATRLTRDVITEHWFGNSDLSLFWKEARTYRQELKRALGIDIKQYRTPISLLRAILRAYGVELESQRVWITHKGKRKQARRYRLDWTSYETTYDYARSRLVERWENDENRYTDLCAKVPRRMHKFVPPKTARKAHKQAVNTG